MPDLRPLIAIAPAIAVVVAVAVLSSTLNVYVETRLDPATLGDLDAKGAIYHVTNWTTRYVIALTLWGFTALALTFYALRDWGWWTGTLLIVLLALASAAMVAFDMPQEHPTRANVFFELVRHLGEAAGLKPDERTIFSSDLGSVLWGLSLYLTGLVILRFASVARHDPYTRDELAAMAEALNSAVYTAAAGLSILVLGLALHTTFPETLFMTGDDPNRTWLAVREHLAVVNLYWAIWYSLGLLGVLLMAERHLASAARDLMPSTLPAGQSPRDWLERAGVTVGTAAWAGRVGSVLSPVIASQLGGLALSF